MCILCVIQKWSRRIATMLPWLVIPLIGVWALSQLLPPAFRFEITSPRLACVFVLLVTLFWYEILMPQLSAWRVRRNARLRERKRFEAIEMQKLRKTATRRCRNCLTPYREQNPGGGRFMCSYCGHISKRPVLDLPVPPGLGLPNPGILKDLVGKSGKILNGKVWSDNGWMCGQDWLDNGNWVVGSFSGKPSYWRKSGGSGFFGGDDHCLAEKSYSRVLVFACRALTAFLLSIMWLWRKIFRVSTSGDDASMDAENRGMLGKRGESGENFQESRGERACRKAEEKRQARLEKEQLEEEERKQREEVARLVEERRRLRDEKTMANKERGKGLPPAREKENKKEAEKKRQERKKEKDRGSSKSNSDAEELEKKAGKEGERSRKTESDRREHYRTGAESARSHNTEIGNGIKGASSNNSRGNAGTRYLDRMRGTFLSSSRAFAGASFFGKGAINSAVITREHKSNGSVDHVHTSANRRDLSQPERVSGKSNISGDDKNINSPVPSEPQLYAAPKKSWQQLFTRSATVHPPSNSTVISRPIGKSQSEAQSPSFSACPVATQQYDNPINFGLPSPFPLSNFLQGSTSSSKGIQLSSESMFPQIGEAPTEFLPEESDIFEDPSYIPDPVSLLGPVSESLDSFQLDLGFVTDMGLEKPRPINDTLVSSELIRPSPIESPMSRLRVSERRNASSFLFPSTPKNQDVRNLPMADSSNTNEQGMWQMWNTSPLGHDGLGLVGGPASWLLPTDLNRSTKENSVHPLPQKTMASLFKKDDQVLSGPPSPQKVFFGSYQNGGTCSNSLSGTIDDAWLPKILFGPMSVCENQFSVHPKEETIQNELLYGSPNGSATNHPFELSPTNCWPKKEWNALGSGESIGNSSITRPPVGLYSSPDVQSLWSYD